MKQEVDVNVEDVVETSLLSVGCTLRFNEFTHSLMVARPGSEEHVIQDPDWNFIKVKLHNLGIKAPAGILEGSVHMIADKPENRYHPVRSYLDSLKWDGVKRIDTWLHDYMKAGNKTLDPYIQAVGKIVLVAAVRRVRQPGCKFDELLTLVAPEGVGKSSGIAALVPNRDWFTDSLPLGDEPKETIEKTTGVWIVEAAELIGSSKSSVAEIKASLSRQVDGPVRMAYAREPVTRARQYVPIATTNENAFLQSMNGDRRFWPVRVRYIDPDKIATDRDQLWAEASAVEASGFSIRLPFELWPLAKMAQEEFSSSDPFEEYLSVDKVGMRITLPEILTRLELPPSQQTGHIATRIAGVMQKLGFAKRRTQVNGVRTTQYVYLTPFDPETFDCRPETAPDDDYDDIEEEVDEKMAAWMEEKELLERERELEDAD